MASLALLLHAHLPFVRHPEHPEFLEESWLFEAITECYLPLLHELDRLVAEGVPFALTFSLTPTLCSMLRDPLLMARYREYLDRAISLAERERVRLQGDSKREELAAFYFERLCLCRQWFEDKWKGDLVGAFGRFQEWGVIEIITCAATHGFLPLMEPGPESIRAQILIARDHYRDCFGRDPQGIWLPECAYTTGIETMLAEANIRWFVIDAHGVMFGNPRPRHAIFTPYFTPAGPAVFGRDRESSRQVWSAEEGYPGDPAYRDFYRDIGFELPETHLGLPQGAPRRFSGLKYHRITSREGEKELYHRPAALEAAARHADHFIASRRQQLGKLAENAPVEPIVVAPFDAELFGHWWYEGPEFLSHVLRHAEGFQLTTPGQYLARNPRQQLLVPSASSWGHHGYWEVWLDESNAWIYPHLHAAARRMIESATQYLAEEAAIPPLIDETLRQMARELLLAQASDWAFLMKTGTAREYSTRRTQEHLLRFTRLYEQLRDGILDENFLANCQWRDNIFPDLDWRYYGRPGPNQS